MIIAFGGLVHEASAFSPASTIDDGTALPPMPFDRVEHPIFPSDEFEWSP